jgi:hypothetical protein
MLIISLDATNNMDESGEVKGHMLLELQQDIDKKRQEQ